MGSTGSGTRDHSEPFPPMMHFSAVYRLISQLIRRAKVVKVDYKKMKVRVAVGNPKKKKAYFQSDWCPWLVPASSNNRTWAPPELGEQVILLCEAGNPTQGVVLRGLSYDKFHSEAETSDYFKETYREPAKFNPETDEIEGEEKNIVGMREYNRKTGVDRHWVRESGSFRWEIGKGDTKEPTEETWSSIIMDKEHIELRVEDTKLVIMKDSIKLHVLGTNTELKLTEASILGHVLKQAVLYVAKDQIAQSVSTGQGSEGAGGVSILTADSATTTIGGEGFLVITAAKVQAGLKSAISYIQILPTEITNIVNTGKYYLSAILASIRVPISGTSWTSTGIADEAPLIPEYDVEGTPVVPVPEAESGPTTTPPDAGNEQPHETVKPPELAKGNIPARPDN